MMRIIITQNIVESVVYRVNEEKNVFFLNAQIILRVKHVSWKYVYKRNK